MSPIRDSPSLSGEEEGKNDGGCTYNQKLTSESIKETVVVESHDKEITTDNEVMVPRNPIQIVYNQKSKEISGNNQISQKSKRNSEQRRPGKITLKEFFPVIKNMEEPKQTKKTMSDNIKTLGQRTQNDAKTKVQAKLERYDANLTRAKVAPRSKVGITPPTVTQEENNKSERNTKCRLKVSNISTERTDLPVDCSKKPSYFRQSKLYQCNDWIRNKDDMTTAGNFFGHSMAQIDNTSVYRVFMQNPNGIDPSPDNLDFQLGLQACYDQCISFIGLTETNTEWNHYIQRENLKESVKKRWDGARIQTSTSSIIFKDKYKPGGTASIVCGAHWTSRVIESGEDVCGMGRSTHIGLQGNQHTKILHITWYRVCKQGKENAGTKTAYMQQYVILRERFPELDPDPRRQSVLDMQLFIMGKIKEGYYIILCTDGNENLSSEKRSWCQVESTTNHAFEKNHNGSILTLLNTCGLVDILHLQHNRDRYPATYIRGQTRIDGIFVSRQIAHCVIRSGLTPFHTFFGGDHRGVFVDFSASMLFQSNTYELARPQGRGLQLTDPRKVASYISALHKQLSYHKVIRKHELLSQIPVGEWTNVDTVKYERLDKMVVQSALYAEKSISRRYSTKYQWSPALLKEVYVFRYARLRLKEMKGLPVTVSSIRYHMKQAKITEAQHQHLDAMEKIVTFLRQARKNLKEYQKQHVELRRNYVEELAEAIILKRFPTAEEGTGFYDEQKAKQIKSLCNRESARNMHMRIRSALERNQGGGLSRIDIPDPSVLFSPDGQSLGDPNDPKRWKGSWLTITDPERLESEIIKMNVKQYHQAIDTPFGQEPLATLFGPDGTTEFVKDLLSGKPLSQELKMQLTRETVQLLEVLQRPVQELYRKEAEITPSQFTSCYKRINEKISSSLSGMHLGHWKAALESPSLVQMYATKMSLPYMHGFNPERWKLVVDVCLPKDEGKFYSHRMRIIRLVESDFNQSLGMIFARPMGHFMEDTAAYPEMQFGSRDGQMSISAVLNKVLTYDIARMERRVLVTEENDAVGCYDRIHQAPVSAFLQRIGVSVAALHCVCRTFDEAVHYIKTSYGLSRQTYKGTKEVPLFGAGQGTTGGPFFWLLMFKVIYDAIDQSLRGMEFVSPCRNHTSVRLGDAFVDDTAFGATAAYRGPQNVPTVEQIKEQELEVLAILTLLGQQYEKLLHATGGALNLAKCFWILLSWRWVDGKAYLKTRSEAPLQLLLTSGYNMQPEEIPRLESSTPYRTLGVHITATGSMSKALGLHRQTSEKFAALLSTSHLSRSEAYFAFVLYFYPKITYSLPVSTFSNKESRWIQAPAMSAFLPKISLNRHTARSIVNGPSSLGGLQLPDVYADQSIGQIRLLLGHLRRGDSTSRLISIAMGIMQLRIGSGTLFLNLPFSKYEGWVEKTWLTSIWKFLFISKLRVRVPTSIRLPSKQRDNDSFIMSEFIYYGYKKGDLELLNQCRLFHQVITVSDIAQADGISIDPAYLERNKYLDRVSPLQWPAQGVPSSKAWTLWRRALLYLQSRGKLKQPLGEWLTRPHQQWNWLLRLEDKALFHKLPSGWERYDTLVRNVGRNTRGNEKPWYSKETGRISRSPVGQLAVATLIHSDVGDLFTVTSSTVLLQTREENPDPEVENADLGESLDSSLGHNYIDKFLSLVQKAGYFGRLIGPLELPSEMDLLDIANHISDQSLLVCSDGSFSQRSGTGSHAWVFSTKEGDILLQGAGPIDCIPELLSSYRPELGGITSNLFLLTVIVRLFDLKEGGVTLFCDNKSALENVFDSVPKRGIYPLLAVDYDLLVLAKDLLQALPITVRPEWVKGHYSGDNRQVQHDLNALVDTMADKFRKNPPRGYAPSATPMYHPRHGAVLIRGGSMITSKMKLVVYEQLFREPLVATICKRFKWTASDFQKVDWDIFSKTFRTYSRTKQLGMTKLVHGLWNTGEQQVKFKQDTLGLCPGCKEKFETTAHVFQCAEIETVDFRERELLQLREFLDEQELPQQLKQNLFHGIAEWTRGEIDAPQYMAPTRGKVTAVDQIATLAYTEQTQLGWEAVFRGHLSVSWRKIYRQAHPLEDGQKEDTLFRRLIRKLQQFSLAMWKHRNEILHGATREEARTLALNLVKSKVEEAFRQYESGGLTLLQRDNYLFTKRTKEERLQGDVDTMMCWLRIVEVAISANERIQELNKQQAAKFFQPFRELGRKNKELRDLSFLRAKITEAYAKYDDGAIQVSEKDKFLFTAQTEEKLLSGEADSLAAWLRRLELAIVFSSREQQLVQGAKRLFRPFFELGRQRLINSSVNAREATEDVDTSVFLTEQQSEFKEKQAWLDTKEQDQVNSELSQQSRQQYRLRKQKVLPIDGLSSTVFSSSVEEEIEEAESISSPGPFHKQAIVDQSFSSDSSYVPSLQLDLPFNCDTDHSESQSSIELEGYCKEQTGAKEAKIAGLFSQIDRIYQWRNNKGRELCSWELSESSEVTSSDKSSTTAQSIIEGQICCSRSGSGSSHNLSSMVQQYQVRNTNGSEPLVGLLAARSNETSSDLSSLGQGAEEAQLSNPMSSSGVFREAQPPKVARVPPQDRLGSEYMAMMDYLHSRKSSAVAMLQVDSPASSIVCNFDEEIDSASSSSIESMGILDSERGQCVIEELSVTESPQPPEQNLTFLQLAQDSGASCSSQTTLSTVTEIREERGTAFRQWYESIQPPELQEPLSASNSDFSVGTCTPGSVLSAHQVRRGLEVLTSSQSNSSSEIGDYNEGLGHYAVRSLPFHPPLEEEQLTGSSTDSEEDSLPTLAPGFSPVASPTGGMSLDGSCDTASVDSQPDFAMEGTGGFTLGSGTSEATGLPLQEGANNQYALRVTGTLQGSAMSVSEYVAMLDSLQGTFDAYEARQLQRQFAGEFYDIGEEEDLQEESSTSLSQPQSEILSETSLEMQIHGGEGFEGSTVGTTATNLSVISVRQIYLSLDSLQVEGLELEIPFAEQDDPPDDDDTLAAL